MPGHSRPTKSKDGKMRYTIAVSHRISVAEVDWIREKTGWGEVRTLNWIRDQLAMVDNSGWYGPVWSPPAKTGDKGEMLYEHGDEFSHLEKDGCEVFREN